MTRMGLTDFLLIAEAVTGIDAHQLARIDRVVIAAESAMAAPWAGYGDVELFPGLEAKAAIDASRILRHHPLMDGNKRTAFLVMIEFVERNDHTWAQPAGGQDEQAEVIERLAAGLLREADFIAWVYDRIA
jgi:death-on-curing protein